MDTLEPLRESPLAPITAPALDPLFWRPARLGVISAWYGHVPFAQWLVAAARPGCLVELGSHAGVSYSAFCDAVIRERLTTQCFAVDTWKGDEHAGFYGEDIFADLNRFNERHYAGFSRLLRCTFDEALQYFADGSIDLLHIDGRHHYEDVAHDFSTWEPKLSPRAVVLFHDTNVRERDFGVWRLWRELAERYPHFEFFHTHGLGVLMHGAAVPEAVSALCHADADRVRERFCLLGERWEQDFFRVQQKNRIGRLEKEMAKLGQEAQAAFEDARDSIAREKAHTQRVIDAYEADKEKLLFRTAELQYEVEETRTHTRALEQTVEYERTRAGLYEQQLALIRGSTLWRLIGILTRIARLVPAPARRAAKSVLRRLLGRPVSTPQTQAEGAASTVATGDGSTSQIAIPSTTSDDLRNSADSKATPEPSSAAAPKPRAVPKPIIPAREKTGRNRIVFVSGEPETPGHDYRVMRAVYSAVRLGWQAEAMTTDSATDDRIGSADILVIWRATWSKDIERIYGTCQRNGIRTIFDVDDLMFRPELARNKLIDGIRSQRLTELEVQRFYIRVNQTMRSADMASCTTAELASHLRLSKKPTFVVPNCWDMESWWRSRLAARRRAQETPDGLIRIGYASGTRTHQKDFAAAAGGIARVLRDHQQARLVLFRDPNGGEGIVVADEFEELSGLSEQIEWRDKVSLEDLPAEIARFDINIAPLETGNPFVEAKSELKYWEAALTGVPTVASPTGPYARAIDHGRTGYLAASDDAWAEHLAALINDPALRRKIAHDAGLDSLWRFGPLHHEAAIGSMLDQAQGGRAAARAMLLDLMSARVAHPAPTLPEREIVFLHDSLGRADVSIIVPVYNYAHYVREALDSAAAQTASAIDLVVIDDASKDASFSVVLDWAEQHKDRFNRLVVARHMKNAGLGFSRNTGFDLAETPYVLPLDADNMLRPDAAKHLAARLDETGAAFAYPTIQRFGKDDLLIGDEPFLAARLVSGNFIDAMALIRRDAWAAAGGYDHVRFGWEDYDFWCRLVELGLWGEHVQEILADYRAHDQSMLNTSTDVKANKIALITDMKKRHDWLDLQAMVL